MCHKIAFRANSSYLKSTYKPRYLKGTQCFQVSNRNILVQSERSKIYIKRVISVSYTITRPDVNECIFVVEL